MGGRGRQPAGGTDGAAAASRNWKYRYIFPSICLCFIYLFSGEASAFRASQWCMGGQGWKRAFFFNIKKAKSPYPPSFISFLLPFPLRLTLSASFYIPFFLCLYPATYFSIFNLSFPVGHGGPWILCVFHTMWKKLERMAPFS